jgi:hypothetical protein
MDDNGITGELALGGSMEQQVTTKQHIHIVHVLTSLE